MTFKFNELIKSKVIVISYFWFKFRMWITVWTKSPSKVLKSLKTLRKVTWKFSCKFKLVALTVIIKPWNTITVIWSRQVPYSLSSPRSGGMGAGDPLRQLRPPLRRRHVTRGPTPRVKTTIFRKAVKMHSKLKSAYFCVYLWWRCFIIHYLLPATSST